jgi:N-formylglutamate amidohydrolase
MNKIILHIPHYSTVIPTLQGFSATLNELEAEDLKLTDWYIDDLFYSSYDDKIIAPFTHIFCDVERFSENENEVMSKFLMGGAL